MSAADDFKEIDQYMRKAEEEIHLTFADLDNSHNAPVPSRRSIQYAKHCGIEFNCVQENDPPNQNGTSVYYDIIKTFDDPNIRQNADLTTIEYTFNQAKYIKMMEIRNAVMDSDISFKMTCLDSAIGNNQSSSGDLLGNSHFEQNQTSEHMTNIGIDNIHYMKSGQSGHTYTQECSSDLESAIIEAPVIKQQESLNVEHHVKKVSPVNIGSDRDKPHAGARLEEGDKKPPVLQQDPINEEHSVKIGPDTPEQIKKQREQRRGMEVGVPRRPSVEREISCKKNNDIHIEPDSKLHEVYKATTAYNEPLTGAGNDKWNEMIVNNLPYETKTKGHAFDSKRSPAPPKNLHGNTRSVTSSDDVTPSPCSEEVWGFTCQTVENKVYSSCDEEGTNTDSDTDRDSATLSSCSDMEYKLTTISCSIDGSQNASYPLDVTPKYSVGAAPKSRNLKLQKPVLLPKPKGLSISSPTSHNKGSIPVTSFDRNQNNKYETSVGNIQHGNSPLKQVETSSGNILKQSDSSKCNKYEINRNDQTTYVKTPLNKFQIIDKNARSMSKTTSNEKSQHTADNTKLNSVHVRHKPANLRIGVSQNDNNRGQYKNNKGHHGDNKEHDEDEPNVFEDARVVVEVHSPVHQLVSMFETGQTRIEQQTKTNKEQYKNKESESKCENVKAQCETIPPKCDTAKVQVVDKLPRNSIESGSFSDNEIMRLVQSQKLRGDRPRSPSPMLKGESYPMEITEERQSRRDRSRTFSGSRSRSRSPSPLLKGDTFPRGFSHGENRSAQTRKQPKLGVAGRSKSVDSGSIRWPNKARASVDINVEKHNDKHSSKLNSKAVDQNSTKSKIADNHKVDENGREVFLQKSTEKHTAKPLSSIGHLKAFNQSAFIPVKSKSSSNPLSRFVAAFEPKMKHKPLVLDHDYRSRSLSPKIAIKAKTPDKPPVAKDTPVTMATPSTPVESNPECNIGNPPAGKSAKSGLADKLKKLSEKLQSISFNTEGGNSSTFPLIFRPKPDNEVNLLTVQSGSHGKLLEVEGQKIEKYPLAVTCKSAETLETYNKRPKMGIGDIGHHSNRTAFSLHNKTNLPISRGSVVNSNNKTESSEKAKSDLKTKRNETNVSHVTKGNDIINGSPNEVHTPNNNDTKNTNLNFERHDVKRSSGKSKSKAKKVTRSTQTSKSKDVSVKKSHSVNEHDSKKDYKLSHKQTSQSLKIKNGHDKLNGVANRKCEQLRGVREGTPAGVLIYRNQSAVDAEHSPTNKYNTMSLERPSKNLDIVRENIEFHKSETNVDDQKRQVAQQVKSPRLTKSEFYTSGTNNKANTDLNHNPAPLKRQTFHVECPVAPQIPPTPQAPISQPRDHMKLPSLLQLLNEKGIKIPEAQSNVAPTTNPWVKASEIDSLERRSVTSRSTESNGNHSIPSDSDSTRTPTPTTPMSPNTAKTLLDTLHKKYYAHQYHRKGDYNSDQSKSGDERERSLTPTPQNQKSREFRQMSAPPLDFNHKGHERKPSDQDSGKASSPSSPFLRSPSGNIDGSVIQDEEELQSFRTEKESIEIEAIEACKWLRAAGFPQYAQMYEDLQFPVDINSVENDHDFLDRDSIQSLFRRLNTLNKCATMKIETPPRKMEVDESDDEDQCALSDKWKFQRSSRRWSRKDLDSPIEHLEKERLKSSSSRDSVITDNDSLSMQDDSPLLHSKTSHGRTPETEKKHIDFYLPEQSSPPVPRFHGCPVAHLDIPQSSTSQFSDTESSTSPTSPRLRRSASEKVKNGAKSFLRKMDVTGKSKKQTRRKHFKEDVEISGPVLMRDSDIEARIQHLNCVDISPTNETPPGGLDITTTTTTTTTVQRRSDLNAPGDNDQTQLSHMIDSKKESFANTRSRNCSEASGLRDHAQRNDSDPHLIKGGYIQTEHGSQINIRTGSFNFGSDSGDNRHKFVTDSHSANQSPAVERRLGSHNAEGDTSLSRMSIYDNVPPTSADSSKLHQELDLILSELFENISGLNNMTTQPIEDIDVSGIQQTEADITEQISDTQLIEDMEDVIDVNLTSLGTQESATMTTTIVSTNQDAISENLDIEVTTTTSRTSSNDNVSEGDFGKDSPSTPRTELRERRDSGVGSSLTRAPSDRRRPRIRWHSFQKCHRPSFNSRTLRISNLSTGQLMLVRKLSLLKLTAVMEKYSPVNRTGWNWIMPKFIKRFKTPDYKDKQVFGVPLLHILQKTGQTLPQCILYAMRFLRRNAAEAVGIFRKSGVRSRIQKLRSQIEANPDMTNFEGHQAYDVADLLKQYFRELPECVLTNKLSETFISIFQLCPRELRLEALQAAYMLMPDENREVLQSLLLFLRDMADHSDKNQMTESNLAVCFAPSLFHLSGLRSSNSSPKRNRKNIGVPDQKELLDQKAAHECLTQMIVDSKKIVTVHEDTISKCKFSYIEQGDPVTLEDLGHRYGNDKGNPNAYLETCIQGLLKEARDKFKGWINVSSSTMATNIDLSYKKVGDGHPLRLWKCCVDLEAPPIEVLNRVLRERQTWDEDLLKWRVIDRLDKNTEIFQYVTNSMAPHPTRDYCELRTWRTDLPKGACMLVSTSVDHPGAPLLGGCRAVTLASRYLIEPCGSGKSRLTHISRVDTRGRSPEWYNKAYGHISAMLMSHLRDSFKQQTDGPETKV
ncbi:unnamed protein product [Owenia fusiformis]|uniref:Uncharacterized protein n=1 Tax=Owenia fusiformis TaxID=6347 RepID=A0A8S4N6K9_OWEFU|nr:unnamed protein product [Owenia fusiformis]